MNKMVKETRQVVEDYILYKIHSNCKIDCYSHVIPSPDGKDLKTPNGSIDFYFSHKKPTKLNLSVRYMANQYEKKYNEVFPDLSDQISNVNMVGCDIKKMLSQVAKFLFPLPVKPITEQINRTSVPIYDENNNIQWGHVLGFLVYAGLLAVRAFECESYETIEQIVSHVTSFFESDLFNWFSKQGGWANFMEWSKASVGRLDSVDSASCGSCSSSIPSAMGIGFVAACLGIGALFIAKK